MSHALRLLALFFLILWEQVCNETNVNQQGWHDDFKKTCSTRVCQALCARDSLYFWWDFGKNVKLVICNWTCLFLWKYSWGAQQFKMLRGVGCRMRWIRSWWRFLLSLAHRIWLILRHCFGWECWWWSRCAVDTCKRFHGSTSKLMLWPIYESLESYGYGVWSVHHPWVVATPHNRSGCAHQFGQKSGAWIGSRLWLGWQSLVPFLNCW